MKVVLFGASGNIGSAIRSELLGRGHEVTAVGPRIGIENDAEIIVREVEG